MRRQILALGVAAIVLTGCWGPSPQPAETTSTPAVASASATPTPTTTPPTGSAATDLNWGTPTAGDEFNYAGAPDPAKGRACADPEDVGQEIADLARAADRAGGC